MDAAWVMAGLGVPVAALLGHAAWQDWQHRRIPNGHCLAIALLALAEATLAQRLLGSAIAGLSLLVLGMLAWQARLLGGGDAKLLAAVAIWAGPQRLVALLGATALLGGGLALLALWQLRGGQSVTASGAAVAEGQPRVAGPGATAGVPYGVAIAGGALWVWLVTTFA